jgi:hypothetical protein
LAQGVADRLVSREWELEFERAMGALCACDEKVLEGLAQDRSLGAVAQRLAAIALDRQRAPVRHAELARYRQSEAHLAQSEGRPVLSRSAVNRPPALLPEHVGEGHRLAWEGLLLGAGWWQTGERAAAVLASMTGTASLETLGVALARAMRGFTPESDQGWRERSIMELQRILLKHPGRETLRWFAESWTACPDEGTRARLRQALEADSAWREEVRAGRQDPTMQRHLDFLAAP